MRSRALIETSSAGASFRVLVNSSDWRIESIVAEKTLTVKKTAPRVKRLLIRAVGSPERPQAAEVDAQRRREKAVDVPVRLAEALASDLVFKHDPLASLFIEAVIEHFGHGHLREKEKGQ